MLLGRDDEVECVAGFESERRSAIAGIYTYGEIATTRGIRGFHNHTLAVLSIG